jgi:hypothetical protein
MRVGARGTITMTGMFEPICRWFSAAGGKGELQPVARVSANPPPSRLVCVVWLALAAHAPEHGRRNNLSWRDSQINPAKRQLVKIDLTNRNNPQFGVFGDF